MNARTVLLAAGTFCLTACGDDENPMRPDGPPQVDAPSQPDGPGTPDAAPFVAPTPIAVPLSAAGPDQLMAAAAGPGGSFYLAGWAAVGIATTDPREVLIAKVDAAGALDTSFGGGDGIATTPLVFRGGNDEIDVVVQGDGAIVVSATVANEANTADRDVALVRLDAQGVVDPGFGDAGVRQVNLNDAFDPGGGNPLVGLDSARGLALDATGRIYLHALQRGEVPADRTDTDFTVVRFTADGDVDDTFGTDGKHLLDITGGIAAESLNATARAIHVQADGGVIASGYTTNPSFGANPQPVLYKLDTAGVLVPEFATGGLFHDIVLTVQTEIYGFAVHGTHLVTGGYGRESGDQNDWISLRFDVATGARDTAWGGTANGAVVFDPSGALIGDNCRNALALPNGKTVMIGSTGPGNMPPMQDAVFAVLSPTGTLDEMYGDGVHTYQFAGGMPGNDQLWGGGVSGTNAALVGYKSPGATQATDNNDDAYVVILPVL
jgi:uncharacterized delta-60 repeat protein